MTAESAQPRNVTRPFPVLWVGSGDETTASPALYSSSLLSVSLSAHVRKMESFRFGQSIRALVSHISRLDDREINLEYAEGYEYRLEVCLRELLAMESIGVLELQGPMC